MSDPKEDRPSWLQLTSIGFELAAAVLGFSLLGWWVDRHFGTHPWGVLGGALLGLVGGMYNLVRESLWATRQADRGKPRPREGPRE
jgi:F0F1-type ATP synthase assembly protein I